MRLGLREQAGGSKYVAPVHDDLALSGRQHVVREPAKRGSHKLCPGGSGTQDAAPGNQCPASRQIRALLHELRTARGPDPHSALPAMPLQRPEHARYGQMLVKFALCTRGEH